eukprot:SAG31_NODE_1320_length_8809_cov_4.243398_7_plen_107_part_00
MYASMYVSVGLLVIYMLFKIFICCGSECAREAAHLLARCGHPAAAVPVQQARSAGTAMRHEQSATLRPGKGNPVQTACDGSVRLVTVKASGCTERLQEALLLARLP